MKNESKKRTSGLEAPAREVSVWSATSEAHTMAASALCTPLPNSLVPLPRPPWLPEAVWPFPSIACDSNGSRIAITDVGQGPVLLFVHTGFWSFVWRDLILRLASDFRCISFDAPGTGRSERLPQRVISLESAAIALRTVIEVLDLRNITLLFHDLGGPSGLAGAVGHPDRISGLCAVNTFAWRPSGAKFRGLLSVMGSGLMREFSVWSGLLTRITASAFGVGLNMDDASRKAFLDGIGRDGTRAFHAYMHDASDSAVYDKVERAITGTFRGLPLVTIFGERNDPLGFQPKWKAMFPDAHQVVVPKGNHFPMCDAPDLVATTIRDWHYERIRPGLQ